MNGKIWPGAGTPIPRSGAGGINGCPCVARKVTPEEIAEIEKKLAARPWMKPSIREIKSIQMADITLAVKKRGRENGE